MQLDKVKIIEPFAYGYLNATEYDDIDYKIGCGLYTQAEYMPITIDYDSYFAGEYDFSDCGVKSHYAHTIWVNEDVLQEEIKKYPFHTDELNFIRDTFAPLDSRKIVAESKTHIQSKLTEMRACWGGDWGGHGNPGYDMFLSLGTEGIKEKINEYRVLNPGRDGFYCGLEKTMDALEIVAERYSALAHKRAFYADEKNKKQLLRISETLAHCPKKPPRDFFEACQMFWLCFMFMSADSPGRFDQFMIDYYRMSGKNDDADECMRMLWRKFFDTRTWNLCIGGRDENGNDMTNELSYLILRIAREQKYNTPNLTMRVHSGTPDRLYDEAIKTFATGIGMPVIYNDDCVSPMLEQLGIAKTDAYNYCMNGCNQIDIMGKSHMGLEDGEVSLIKALEFTLFNGVCSYCGEKIGLDVGNAEHFSSFAELTVAYKKEVEYLTDVAVQMSNNAQKIYAEYAPNPLRSCIIEGCIEKGRDYKDGGPMYNHGQILAEGIADAADSLAAIKHYIYETKKYTMGTLKAALKANFYGYDELYKDFSRYKKFGNNDDYVDLICVDIVDHFFKYLRTKKTYRGGVYTGGCSPFNRAAFYGEKVGAMPNGKHEDDSVIADSIGAVPGEDSSGITELINSVLKYNQKLAGSGFVLNLKFNKGIFDKQKGVEAVKSLLKAYFRGGGQQISPTVVSREELEDAVVNPERHKDLIVRVGGYSDYFVRLSSGLQQNIIRRTSIDE